MKRKIVVGNLEHEIETINKEGTCRYCSYSYHDGKTNNHWCKSIRNPKNLDDKSDSFFNYCRFELCRTEIPLPGTLDFLPHDELPKQKEYTLSLPEAVKKYCSEFCIFECTKSCPLYNYKNGTKNN